MKYSTVAALLLFGATRSAGAQVPAFSTRSMGLGDGYTASARGYEAIAWNPALLAMPGHPAFSFNLFQVSVRGESNTFGLGDFRKYEGKFLTTQDKNDILDKVRQGDPNRLLSLNTGVGIGAIAVTFGSFGLSFSGAAEAGGDLSSDAVELALFGNVTRRQPGQVYSGAGTGVRGWGAGTIAASYALRLPVPTGALALGATAKFNRGVGVVRGENVGTSLQSAPVFDATAGFHALLSDLDSAGTNNGNGFGLDLGGALDLGSGLRLGLSVENVLNSTNWSDDNLVYYRKVFRIRQTGDQVTDTTLADIERAPYNPADTAQRRLHDSLTVGGTFPMRIRAGLNYNTRMLTVVAGATFRAKEALDLSAAQRASVGAELRILPFLPLRGGLASDLSGGFTLSAGVGLKLGPVRIDTAVTNSNSGDHKGFQVGLGLAFMN